MQADEHQEKEAEDEQGGRWRDGTDEVGDKNQQVIPDNQKDDDPAR